MSDTPDLSVLIPVGHRHDALSDLHHAYKNALDNLDISYELFYILDGNRVDALAELQQLLSDGEQLTLIKLSREFGEATALMAGVEQARAQLLLTLPAYFQVVPEELGRLFEERSTGAEMIIAKRWPRRGGKLEGLRRAAFHRILSRVTGQQFSDLGCGVRLFERRVVEDIVIYGDQHRFFPVLAQRVGFRVHEIPLKQSPFDEFRGRYKLKDYLRRLLDIVTVFFLVRFTKKPLRFFGAIGSLTFLLGAVFLGYVVIERLFFFRPLADRPALLLSSLLVVLGLQIFGLGLLGELIIFTHARKLKEYRIEKIIN